MFDIRDHLSFCISETVTMRKDFLFLRRICAALNLALNGMGKWLDFGENLKVTVALGLGSYLLSSVSVSDLSKNLKPALNFYQRSLKRRLYKNFIASKYF